jgi:hypothetical protein
MKLQQPFKKSLANIAVFLLSIFAVVGLSYAAAPNLNAFKPINEGSDTQVRCKAYDTTKPIRPGYSYTDCQYSSRLITNGIIIKTKNTTFEIQGDPSSSNAEIKKGAFYVGCSTNSKYSQSIRDGCGNYDLTGNEPEAYLNGDVYIYELADSSATTDRKICISSAGVVKLCP